MPITTIPVGGQARSLHVQQIINWLRGDPTYSEPVSFTGTTTAALSTTYALTVRNREAVDGRAFKVEDSIGTTPLLTVGHAGTELRPKAAGSIFRVRNLLNTENTFEVLTTGVIASAMQIRSGAGILSSVVDTSSAQTLSNKAFTGEGVSFVGITNSNQYINNYADILQIGNSPGTPATGRARLYMGQDNNLHFILPGSGEDRTVASISGGVAAVTVNPSLARTLLLMGG